MQFTGWCVVSAMADATYAVVDKAKKSGRVAQSSEVNQAIYAAVDKPKKKKNRNVLTAEPTFSHNESSMLNRDALQEYDMEKTSKGEESMSESYFVTKAKDVAAKEKAAQKASAGKMMLQDNNNKIIMIACIFIAVVSVAYLITLVCLVVLFNEIATLKASQETTSKASQENASTNNQSRMVQNSVHML